MIELRSIHKRFGDHVALDGLDVAVEEGVTSALIGPSGCGKSTALRLMIGLIEPTEGEVWFEGERLTKARLRDARLKMGYVIQEGGLFPHMTARRNVSLMAHRLGWSRSDIDKRVEELAGLVQLDMPLLDSYPVQLSGGQRQRISLMRALMLDPDALLLDEPLGALDPLIRTQLQRELADIFDRLGKTVVVVTHDLAEAAFLSDDIILLREGRLEQRADLATLQREPANDFVKEFVEAQSANAHLLAGMATEDKA
jgi:osmoprotectant transport system ATP-binding protein